MVTLHLACIKQLMHLCAYRLHHIIQTAKKVKQKQLALCNQMDDRRVAQSSH